MQERYILGTKDLIIGQAKEASSIPRFQFLAEPCRAMMAYFHYSRFLLYSYSPLPRILLLTDAVYRAIGLCHRDLLEAADASAIAAFGLWYPSLALFVEEAGLVHVHQQELFILQNIPQRIFQAN